MTPSCSAFKPRRIILSEQGIHCLKSAEGEKLQAAGFAYVWEKLIPQRSLGREK